MATGDPFGADAPTLRREARERAVSLLYEAQMRDLAPADLLDAQPVPVDGLAAELVVGVADHAADLDAVIDAHLRDDWRPDRVAVLDRLVLRLGVYELTHRPEVPVGAVTNEAVELAKRFGGTDDSYRFVNGVLSRVAAEVRDGG